MLKTSNSFRGWHLPCERSRRTCAFSKKAFTEYEHHETDARFHQSLFLKRQMSYYFSHKEAARHENCCWCSRSSYSPYSGTTQQDISAFPETQHLTVFVLGRAFFLKRQMSYYLCHKEGASPKTFCWSSPPPKDHSQEQQNWASLLSLESQHLTVFVLGRAFF